MLHAKGSLLSIDVGDRTASTEDIDDTLEAFIGGRGAATKLAHDRIPFEADPFGPENRVYLASGPLQMSRMSFTGRMSVTGVSPLTNGLVSANAGGYLSRNFVATGHPVVEFTGQADELLALHVTDDGVEFEAVPELEQALVSEVTEYMTEHHGLEAENIVAIGPAGENLVRYACPMTYESRAFGRGGLGAVLGSKNIKAVTFEGDSTPEVSIPEEVQMEIHRDAATSDDRMKRQGTTGGTEWINENFSLPTRYYEKYHFEHADQIGGDAVEEKKYKTEACSVCAFACKLPTRDEETGLETEGPEFETVYSFGSISEVDDIVDVMQSNELCDEFGMDTISAGVTCAAYLKSEDEFGNAALVHETLEKIAYREGVGDLLAEGVHRFADELGVRDYTVKGMEFAAHDGRVLQGLGLQYCVANRGGDHMYASMQSVEYRGDLDPEGTLGKAGRLVENESYNGFRDSGIVCAFSGSYISEENLETLFDCEYGDLLDVGNRVVELERHFNNKRGFDREDDMVPYELPDIQQALDEYYTEHGWNDDGTVPDERVEAYGAVADD